MDFIQISICLSDIPREKIKLHENGKKYVNIICASRKEKGKYDETHTVFMSQTKEERERGAEKQYIGSGKALSSQQQQPVTPEAIDNLPPIGDDNDLPF